MIDRGGRFLFGLFTGLLASGLLYLLLAEPRGLPVELLPPSTHSPLRVHVAGAVRRPGVIELPAGSIVADAIQAAGGADPGANLDELNLASQVQDGQRIMVPAQGSGTASQIPSPAEAAGLLDLNRATAADLERLPGIGPTRLAQLRDLVWVE